MVPDKQRSNRWTTLAWLEPFWIALLAPSLLLPGRFWTLSLQPFLVLLLLLFWPIRRMAYGRFSLRSPLDGSLALLALWLPVSLWVSVDFARSISTAGVLCLGMAAYFALINWPPARHRPQLVAWGLAAIGLGLILLGPILVGTPIPLLSRLGLEQGRVLFRTSMGETLNANVWAGSLLLVIPFYAALAVTPGWGRHGWPRWAGALLCLAAVGLLFLTDSRGAYLALALSLLTLLLLRWPRSAFVLLPLLLIGAPLHGLVGFPAGRRIHLRRCPPFRLVGATRDLDARGERHPGLPLDRRRLRDVQSCDSRALPLFRAR